MHFAEIMPALARGEADHGVVIHEGRFTYRELRELVAEGGTVQMFARVGYGPEVPPSPRWPLGVKLVDAG